MKKLLLVSTFLLISLNSELHSAEVGNWDSGFYVDEFGDKTNDGFIRLTASGYFSNSATTNSRLGVVMMFSDGKIKPWFRFYEYDGNNALKGVYNDSNPISCRVKGVKDSNIFPIGLYQAQGWDYLRIDDSTKKSNANVQKLRILIQDEDIAKFSCYRERYSSDKYRFDLNFKGYNQISKQFSE